MKPLAALIGVVEVVAVHEQNAVNADGSRVPLPPIVEARVLESYHGLATGIVARALWDDANPWRRGQVRSFMSGMQPKGAGLEAVPAPPVGSRYLVFWENHNGLLRDIYGWERGVVRERFPDNGPPVPRWPVPFLGLDPLRQVPIARHPYNRRSSIREITPADDPVAREAILDFEVIGHGEYWLGYNGVAVRIHYHSARPNPDWPLRHTVVGKDTLSGLASTYYGDSSRWKPILEANPSIQKRGGKLDHGSSILIPPEPQDP